MDFFSRTSDLINLANQTTKTISPKSAFSGLSIQFIQSVYFSAALPDSRRQKPKRANRNIR